MKYIASEKQFWAEGSGLLPIRLSPDSDAKQYILLDGGLYDFCLDLTGESDSADNYYSAAWSSDVKNYVSVHKDEATVYNWSRQQPESVPLRVVQDKFPAFLRILNSTSFKTSDDVTPFILGLFSRLRNLTREQREPIEALNLLFKLLVTLKEENLSQKVCDQWGIINIDEPVGFENLQAAIRQGVRRITPNLDYILRHGSGPLFETAHREALFFDSQFDLFEGVSSNLGYSPQPKYTEIHYTPRYLVRSIVENAIKCLDLNRPNLTVLDPACGSGTFLQEVLKQLRESEYHGNLHIKGFDTSMMAVQTARFLLNYENRQQWNNRITIDICHKDSLIENWGENDLILMNPPFISSELIRDKITKQNVNEILADMQMKKRPNMAAAFFYKAVQALSLEGVLGAVLPSSIFIQEQYHRLRNTVREIVKLETVAQLGNFVFSDALTDTSFVLARKQNDNAFIPLNIWCSNYEQSAFEAIKGWRKMQYDNVSQRINENFNIYTPSHFPIIKDSWKVLPQKDDIFSQEIKKREQSGDLKPLSNIFNVRQGVIKGNRNLFEIYKDEHGHLPKSEKCLFRPVASSQTIEYGSVKEERYIWYPYSSSGLQIHTEEELAQYKWSYKWLSSHKEVLLSRKGVSKWWDLTRSRYELFSRKETMLCSKRSGGAHSFALASGEFVVEEGNVFIFRSQRYCEEDKYFYLAFFSSSVFQRMLTIFARPLKAGYDLGNIQIKNIPIVDVCEPGIRGSEEYCKLVEYGREYAAGCRGRREYFDKYVLAFYR